MGGMEGIKGERSEQQNDKAENHHQNGVDSGRFEVQKVRFLIKNAVWLYSELCFLLQRGAILLGGKWPAKSRKRGPNMHLGVNSSPHRERAKEQNNAPRLGQEAFSCKIMKFHLSGFVNGL